MSRQVSSLAKFAVNPNSEGGAVQPTASFATQELSATNGRGRGKNKRVGVAVRLGHDDWYRLHDLAVREHTSLQRLITRGLSELLRQKGLPPLSDR